MATVTLRTLSIVLTANLLSGCGAYPIIGIGEGFDVEPVASLVVPFMTERNDVSLNFFVDRHVDGQPPYDDYYQPPSVLGLPVTVPCTSTDRIGVVFFVKRSGRPYEPLSR
ncbi:MAG: hypothetical protein AAGF72_16025, partial [Pseudomonadota bacterium]